MKGKYITTQVLMACRSKKPGPQKDIHEQLQETIEAYKKLLERVNDKISAGGRVFPMETTALYKIGYPVTELYRSVI